MNTTTGMSGTGCLTKLTDLNGLAVKSGKKKLAVAVAHDEHCLEAICAVDKMGLVEAILVGNEIRNKDIAAKL
ncbi:MAG TPA: phosphate acyltransferase, partial [Bacteroidales bacterium]|nr:phosphate acyltransferase [Bacteroidales bacterium]